MLSQASGHKGGLKISGGEASEHGKGTSSPENYLAKNI